MGNWIYNGKEITEIPENYIGFVYEIIINDLHYIGRKIFYSTTRKIIKNHTRRKKVVKESDWRNYYGSSEFIKSLVLTHGKENVTRIMLRLCKSKSEMAYFEAKTIFERDALLKDNYINRWITCQINAKNLEYLKNVN